MSVRLVHAYPSLSEMDEQTRVAWQTWLDRHGIEPEDVVLDSTIEMDDGNRTITYWVYQRDSAGLPTMIDDEVKTIPVVMQLEAPALHLPGEKSYEH